MPIGLLRSSSSSGGGRYPSTNGDAHSGNVGCSNEKSNDTALGEWSGSGQSATHIEAAPTNTQEVAVNPSAIFLREILHTPISRTRTPHGSKGSSYRLSGQHAGTALPSAHSGQLSSYQLTRNGDSSGGSRSEGGSCLANSTACTESTTEPLQHTLPESPKLTGSMSPVLLPTTPKADDTPLCELSSVALQSVASGHRRWTTTAGTIGGDGTHADLGPLGSSRSSVLYASQELSVWPEGGRVSSLVALLDGLTVTGSDCQDPPLPPSSSRAPSRIPRPPPFGIRSSTCPLSSASSPMWAVRQSVNGATPVAGGGNHIANPSSSAAAASHTAATPETLSLIPSSSVSPSMGAASSQTAAPLRAITTTPGVPSGLRPGSSAAGSSASTPSAVIPVSTASRPRTRRFDSTQGCISQQQPARRSSCTEAAAAPLPALASSPLSLAAASLARPPFNLYGKANTKSTASVASRVSSAASTEGRCGASAAPAGSAVVPSSGSGSKLRRGEAPAAQGYTAHPSMSRASGGAPYPSALSSRGPQGGPGVAVRGGVKSGTGQRPASSGSALPAGAGLVRPRGGPSQSAGSAQAAGNRLPRPVISAATGAALSLLQKRSTATMIGPRGPSTVTGMPCVNNVRCLMRRPVYRYSVDSACSDSIPVLHAPLPSTPGRPEAAGASPQRPEHYHRQHLQLLACPSPPPRHASPLGPPLSPTGTLPFLRSPCCPSPAYQSPGLGLSRQPPCNTEDMMPMASPDPAVIATDIARCRAGLATQGLLDHQWQWLQHSCQDSEVRVASEPAIGLSGNGESGNPGRGSSDSDDAGFGLPAWAWRSVAVFLDTGGPDMTPRMRQRQEDKVSHQQQQKQEQQQQEQEQQQPHLLSPQPQQQKQPAPVAPVPRPLLLGNTDDDPSLMPLRRLSTTPKRSRRPCAPLPSVPLPAIADTPLEHVLLPDFTSSIAMPEPALTESPSPISPTPPRPTYQEPVDMDCDCAASSRHHRRSSELPLYRLPSDSGLSSDSEEPAVPVAAPDLDTEVSAGESVLPMKELSRFDLDALVGDSLLVPGTEGACTDWIEAISPPRLHAAGPSGQAVAAQGGTTVKELEEDFAVIAQYGASCRVAASGQGSIMAMVAGNEKDGLPGALTLERLGLSSSGSDRLSPECSVPDAERFLSSVTDEPVSLPGTPLPCSGADTSGSTCQLAACAEGLDTAAEAASPRHTPGSCRPGRRPVHLSISLENLQAVDLQALLQASDADMLITVPVEEDSEECAMNATADRQQAAAGIAPVELEPSTSSEDVASIVALQQADVEAAVGMELAVELISEDTLSVVVVSSAAVDKVTADLGLGGLDSEDSTPVCVLLSVSTEPCTRGNLDASMVEEASVLLGVDSCLSLGLPEPLAEVLSMAALGTPSDGALYTAADLAGVIAVMGCAAAAAVGGGVGGVSVFDSSDMASTSTALLAVAAACMSTWGAVACAAAALAPTPAAALASVALVAVGGLAAAPAASGDITINKRCHGPAHLRRAGRSCVGRPCGVLDRIQGGVPKGLVPCPGRQCERSSSLTCEDITGAVGVGGTGDSKTVLCEAGARTGAGDVSTAADQQDTGAESAVTATDRMTGFGVPFQACIQPPPEAVELAPQLQHPETKSESLSIAVAADRPDETLTATQSASCCPSPKHPAAPPSLLNVAAVAVEACSATIAAMRAAGCDRSALRQVARAFGVMAGRQYAAERDAAMMAGSLPVADWSAVQALVRRYLGGEEDAFSIAAVVAAAFEPKRQASTLQQQPSGSLSGEASGDMTAAFVPALDAESSTCSNSSSREAAAAAAVASDDDDDGPQPSLPDPCTSTEVASAGVEDVPDMLTPSCAWQQLLTTVARLSAVQATDNLRATQAEASSINALAADRQALIASIANTIAVQFAELDTATLSESAALAALQEQREALMALIASGAACNAAGCMHASTAAAAAVQCLVQHRRWLLQQVVEVEAAGSSVAAASSPVEEDACQAMMAARKRNLRAYDAETAAAVAAAVSASWNETIAFCKLARVRNIVTGVCLAIEAMDVAQTLRSCLAEDEALRLLACERDQEKALCAIIAVTSSDIAYRAAVAEEAALEAVMACRQQDLTACSHVAAASTRTHCCAADHEATATQQLLHTRSQLACECLVLEAACAALLDQAVGGEEEAIHALAAGRQELLGGIAQHAAANAAVAVRSSSAVAHAVWVQWSRRHKQLIRVAQAVGCQAADANQAAYSEAAACDAMAVLRRGIAMLVSAHTAAEVAANVRTSDCEQQAYERLARLCGVIIGVCHAVEAAEAAVSLRAGAAQMESMWLLALQRSSLNRVYAAVSAAHSATAVGAAAAEAGAMGDWAERNQGWIQPCLAVVAESTAMAVRASDLEDAAICSLAAGRQHLLAVVAEQAAVDAATALDANSGESHAIDTVVLDRLLRQSSTVHEKNFTWCAAAFSSLMQQRVSQYTMMCGTSMVLLTVQARALAAAGYPQGQRPGTCAMDQAAASGEAACLTSARLGSVSMPLHRALVRSFPLRSLSGMSEDSEAGSVVSTATEGIAALPSYPLRNVGSGSDLLAECSGKRPGSRVQDLPSHRSRGLGLGLLVRGPDGRLCVRAFSSYFSRRAVPACQA